MKIIQTFKKEDLGNCLILYSNGPSSEFKNKFIQKILLDISKELKINIMWKFFATSHGKGVVDGIGGSAKACVRARVMSKDEKVVVQSASDFVKVASKDLKNVKMFEVTENDVAKMRIFLMIVKMCQVL